MIHIFVFSGEETVTIRLNLEAEFHFTHLIMKFKVCIVFIRNGGVWILSKKFDINQKDTVCETEPSPHALGSSSDFPACRHVDWALCRLWPFLEAVPVFCLQLLQDVPSSPCPPSAAHWWCHLWRALFWYRAFHRRRGNRTLKPSLFIRKSTHGTHWGTTLLRPFLLLTVVAECP